MVRFHLLACCLGAMLLGNIASAQEHAPASKDAIQAYEAQRSLARQLIQQRAAQESRERQARIEARKRQGISLQRPFKPMPWYSK